MSLSFGAGSDQSAASYQNIEYEVIEHNHYENMVEIVNMEPDAECTVEVRSIALVKSSAQIEPFYVSKGYAYFILL